MRKACQNVNADILARLCCPVLRDSVKDVTDYLRNGYWPSYNVPFIDKIYKDLNYEVVDGENIQYTQSPRAKIFKRDAKK